MIKNQKTLKISLILILLTFSGLILSNAVSTTKTAYADEIENTSDQDSVTTQEDSIVSINRVSTAPFYPTKAFSLGEILSFKIRYGFVTAGSAVMMVKSVEEKNGRKYYHIQTKARSSSGFDWIYKVRDEVNTFVDFDGLYPLRFEKKLREGSYKADQLVDFFHADSMAKLEYIRYESNMKVSKRRIVEFKIPPFANDILSAFYLIRNQNLEVGKPIYLTASEKDKVYNLKVEVYKKEIIDADAGKFRCFEIEPLLEGEGIFKQKGRLKIWLTDDQYKIPVQMTSEVIVGHITTELTEIQGIKGPIPSRVD